MRVIFMGTPEFSVPILDGLIAAGHEIACVYCQPPRPAGRGKKERLTPVHSRANALGLDVRHPVTLKTPEAQVEFSDLKADVAVVVAYGLILPKAILEAPLHGCLNIHASLLPRWRGAAPIHRAILAGDAKTGICVMQMEAGLDTGPVLLRRETPIGADDTTGQLHDRLSDMGAEAIVAALSKLEELSPVAQGEDGITYAAKIDKSEAKIDWGRPAAEVDRQIRGLSPFPGAWSLLDGQRIKFLDSRVAERSGEAGTLLGGFTIACGTGAVEIVTAQRAGKSPQPAEVFLRGLPMQPGAVFGD